MSPVEIGLIGIAAILIFILFFGVQVGFILIFVGFAGVAMITGFNASLSGMAITAFDRATNYDIGVIPLFLLMSAFISRSEIGKEAYDTARAWIGQAKGGLAMATVGACGLFAACTGSSLAGAVTMGKVAYPEMKRLNYDSKLSVGCIAAGGTLGILIPPSMGFILIGILTELSIGQLFIAGIIPGVLEILFYMATIYILCRFNPRLGPASARTTVKEKIFSLKLTWPVAILFLLIIGGIYGGVFTPTEAGAVGAFGAVVISLARRQLTRAGIFEALVETARIAAMILTLIIGAFVFNGFLAVTRIPYVASEFIVALGLNRYIILAIILFIYIILGMVFDIHAILILTIPILFPTVVALGFHPIWYGVLMVRIIEIGMVTPPFGINLFGLAGVIDVDVGTLYRGIIPFVIADICHVALLIAIPALSTFLPSIMIGA